MCKGYSPRIVNIIPLVQAKIKQVFLEITGTVIKSTADNSKLENVGLGTLKIVDLQLQCTVYSYNVHTLFCVAFNEIQQTYDLDYDRHSPAKFTVHIKSQVEYLN